MVTSCQGEQLRIAVPDELETQSTIVRGGGCRGNVLVIITVARQRWRVND